MIDNAGNKLIYNVENVTYNNVTYSNGNEINLLEKTNQELSDLSQEKQNRIKEINDSLKVVTDPDAQVALKKELLRLQNEVMKIETQLYSNKIVEDARAREELAATKDMAKNTKRYADIPSEIRELETKLEKAVIDADKQKIQEKIDALKEEMKEIPIEQSNKFNDTFTKEYVNQLNQKYDALVNKKDGELKSLREEIQSGNLDADTKMKKIDDFNAKVAAIPTVDIKVAKTAADLVVENTNKAKDAK